jgi:hypothetical protein
VLFVKEELPLSPLKGADEGRANTVREGGRDVMGRGQGWRPNLEGL